MPSVATDSPATVARPELWRIADRSTFVALRLEGRRIRRGPLSLTWLGPKPGGAPLPPRVAFAVSRAAGNAVVRNRIRRRLRACLREIQRTEGLPSGAYLLGAGGEAARLAWPTLLATVKDLVAGTAAAR